MKNILSINDIKITKNPIPFIFVICIMVLSYVFVIYQLFTTDFTTGEHKAALIVYIIALPQLRLLFLSIIIEKYLYIDKNSSQVILLSKTWGMRRFFIKKRISYENYMDFILLNKTIDCYWMHEAIILHTFDKEHLLYRIPTIITSNAKRKVSEINDFIHSNKNELFIRLNNYTDYMLYLIETCVFVIGFYLIVNIFGG